MLTLSLFPGIGLLDHAFGLEGYCTVRGPDPIWGGDVRTFHPPAGRFDGLIGGPPCQSFSSLVHLVRANGHEPTFGNLIPEFERCVHEAQPTWFLMENVPQAPKPHVEDYGVTPFLLDNSALDSGDGFGHEQRRIRMFCFGQRGVSKPPDLRRWVDLATFLLPDAASTLTQWTPNNSAEAKGRVSAATVVSRPGLEVVGKGGKVKRQAIAAAKRTLAPPLPAGHEQPAGLTARKRFKALSSSNGGSGSQRSNPAAGNGGKGRYRLADAMRLQGLPATFLDHCPFTKEGALKAIANGVPIFMGRALAKAITEAMRCS